MGSVEGLLYYVNSERHHRSKAYRRPGIFCKVNHALTKHERIVSCGCMRLVHMHSDWVARDIGSINIPVSEIVLDSV